MSLSIEYSLAKGITPELQEVFSLLDDDNLTDLNKIGARAAAQGARAYHREFESRGGWENPALSTHGAGRQKTGFGNTVTDGWYEEAVSPGGFTISNDTPWYAQKVRGGRITPKTAKMLTIPVIPEAHGVRARDYPGDLFVPRGKNYLAEKVGESEIRAVYVFSRGVDQPPWTGALPSQEDLTEVVSEAYLERINAILS